MTTGEGAVRLFMANRVADDHTGILGRGPQQERQGFGNCHDLRH